MLRAPLSRIFVLFNNDYGPGGGGPKRGEEARAGVRRTAEAVASALRAVPGNEVVAAPIDGPPALFDLLRQPVDLAFNLCESLRGDPRYEIPVPVILETHRVPYTGNGPLALRLALDKSQARAALVAGSVPVPEGGCIATESDLARIAPAWPAIVKPAREDGSIGIEASSVVHDRAALGRRVRFIHKKLRQPAIVEAFVDGREFNVSVLGDAEPRCLPLAEIDFSPLPPGVPRIISYRAKWHPRTVEYKSTMPRFGTVDEALGRRIRRAALGAFRALGLRDYARVDIRVDARGQPFVIDVNPNCDLAPDAGFAKAAKAAGLDYPQLVQRLVTFALERGKRNAPTKAPKRRRSLPA